MSTFRCKTHDVTVEITRRDGHEHRQVFKALGASAGCLLQVGDGGRSADEADLVRMATDGTERYVAAAKGRVQVETIARVG